MIMSWGVEKADELGFETWLDATVHGVPLYKNHGFVVREENNIHPKTEMPDEDWTKLEKEISPMVLWPMSRAATSLPVGES